MAVLETIRVKLGILITVLIAVALLSFIIDPSTLQSVASSSSKYDVGEIDGKSISYVDFQTDVDRFTTINEIITGSSASSEEQQLSIRNAAWQSLLDKYLFIKNAEKAGIHVGEEEMVALISGDMLSPVFAQNQAFYDANGNFSKEMLLEFVNYINTDQTGRLKMYWDYLQTTAQTQQYYDKYMSLFVQSDFTNPLMMTEEIAENNNTFDVEFVMLPIGIMQDSTITVSDSEIKKYYEAHKKFYKQQASRDIEYVVFEVVPSAEDIAAANQALVDVYDEFAAAENMKAFLMANSDRQFDTHWYKAGELTTVSKDVNDFVFGNNRGTSEVFQNGNFFRAVRVLEHHHGSDHQPQGHPLQGPVAYHPVSDHRGSSVRLPADHPHHVQERRRCQPAAAELGLDRRSAALLHRRHLGPCDHHPDQLLGRYSLYRHVRHRYSAEYPC